MKYKKEAEIRMPNQIQYSCYAQLTMTFCHACYMGVSYVMVLRLPNISEGKLRKEPTKDYTLYQIEKDGKKIVYSLSPNGKYSNNKDCSSESKPNNSTKKNNGQTKLNNSTRKNNGKNKSKRSLMNRFTGFTTGLFKTKNNKKSTGYTQLKQTNTTTTNSGSNNPETAPEDGNPEEENQGVFSKCSIL